MTDMTAPDRSRTNGAQPMGLSPPQELGGWYRTLLQTVDQKIMAAVEPLTLGRTITLWYVLDGGGAPLAANAFIEAPVDFPFVITGWTALSRDAGQAILNVSRSTPTTYPVFTSLVASAAPMLQTNIASDASQLMTGWTTIIQGSDIIAVSVTSNVGGLKRISFGLRAKPFGQLNR